MAWRKKFNLGITYFQSDRLEQAVLCFTEAIAKEDGASQYIIYDSRGAAYEQLKRIKDALLDAKTTIKLAPDQWHGYMRSARLFSLIGKFDASLQMADLALARMKPQHAKRRVEVEKLKQETQEQRAAAKQVGKENIGTNPAASISPEGKRALRIRRDYIAALPIELFGEVFREVVQADSANLITLLRVCCSWRSIAEGTGHLWDNLILTNRAPQRKLRRWMKHSGGRIRELHVWPGASSHLDWPFEDLKHIRWEGLQILHSNDWNVFDHPKGTMKTSIWNLQELALGPETVDGIGFRSLGESMYSILGSCPSFHSLTLKHIDFNWELAANHFTTLTALHLHRCRYVAPQFILPAISANQYLQTLIIDSLPFPEWKNILDPKQPKIALQDLKTVKLVGNLTANLLECFSAPGLIDLELYSYSRADILLTYLTTQPIALERLSIGQSAVSSKSLIEFILKAPTLTHLELIALSGSVNNVIEALANSPASSSMTPPCPSLTHLNVSRNSDVKTGPIVRLVRTRLPPGADSMQVGEEAPLSERITTLILDGCEQVDVQWLSWLRQNVPVVSCTYQTKKKAGWKR